MGRFSVFIPQFVVEQKLWKGSAVWFPNKKEKKKSRFLYTSLNSPPTSCTLASSSAPLCFPGFGDVSSEIQIFPPTAKGINNYQSGLIHCSACSSQSRAVTFVWLTPFFFLFSWNTKPSVVHDNEPQIQANIDKSSTSVSMAYETIRII